MKLLMVDNYDSFTYNIVQYFGELNQEVKVVRNDQVSLEDIERWQPKYLVIGPGPCSPTEAGISIPAIQHFAGKIPLLGVCLGHQSIGQAFGGKITFRPASVPSFCTIVLQTGRLSSGSSKILCVGGCCFSLSGVLEGSASRKQMPDISIMEQIMKIILLELRIRVSFERKCREC